MHLKRPLYKLSERNKPAPSSLISMGKSTLRLKLKVMLVQFVNALVRVAIVEMGRDVLEVRRVAVPVLLAAGSCLRGLVMACVSEFKFPGLGG